MMHTLKTIDGVSLKRSLAAAAVLASGAMLAPAVQAAEEEPVGLAELFVNLLYNLKFGMSHEAYELQEDYMSGLDDDDTPIAPPGTMTGELWRAKYDEPDGWLYGLSTAVAPSFLCGGVLDFAYRTGDLDGRFTTTPLMGGDVYPGNVDIDRETWEIGISYPLRDWFYAKVDYFNIQDDVAWKFDDGDLELQEYELQGLRAGVGATQDYPVGASGLNLVLDGFVGLVHFDYEHVELDGGLKTDWDGFGYVARGGAQLQYPLSQVLNAVGGASYEFMDTSDGSLDLQNYGLRFTLGLSGNF